MAFQNEAARIMGRMLTAGCNQKLNNDFLNIQRELTQKNLQMENLNERLEMLAISDLLTGIYHRRTILDRVETEVERAFRKGGFSVLR
jgi:PleD family two-component response regulator